MIRKSGDWMNLLHERLLESLRDNGPSSPSMLSVTKGIRGSKEEITAGCSDLEMRGLITEVDEGTYQLSESGQMYLEGELDLADSIQTFRLPSDIAEVVTKVMYGKQTNLR